MTTGDSTWHRLLNQQVKTPLINKANPPLQPLHITNITSTPPLSLNQNLARIVSWPIGERNIPNHPEHSSNRCPYTQSSNAAVPAGVEAWSGHP
ncbi:hypothetical protein PGT21_026436 [Puccinia graminis f. sp. tritici]|uniref:Uncharacterized protein n=1 Tax=Puccinia graminis f. sp. tritici TaxID=56615 RepID=A0A5B0QBT3_PUCGR|nr:hypothetical protein PGT21_026436 [Puccinia graminis f. sp. tritici]